MYNTVNYFNQIRFKVNNIIFNFLIEEGKYLLENYINLNKEDAVQNTIIIKVARTYLNIPFYITTNSDWRGRIYTQSSYLNYQGNELSSSLIAFYKGEKLNESGYMYLKIYGANCYDYKNISKNVYEQRLKWVDENLENILAIKPEFMLKSKSPLLFAAFCLNIKYNNSDPKAIIYTPVFLDATCSGIQHLAAILKDFDLGKNVNLVDTTNDKVIDIYSNLLPQINYSINKCGIEDPIFSQLKNIRLERKHVKQPIITKFYNVKILGIAEICNYRGHISLY
jgi:DNA-directed RNA polymerase, mitochondrial